MQLDDALLARQPALRQPRRLPHGGGELLVAAAAGPAARHGHLLAGPDEVEARAVPARHLRAGRDADDQRRPVGAEALRALAVPAPLRPVVRAALERLEVAQGVVAAQDHVAAAAAVTAVGAALGDVRLAAERQRAVAAPAGADLDPGTIGEHQMGRRADISG